MEKVYLLFTQVSCCEFDIGGKMQCLQKASIQFHSSSDTDVSPTIAQLLFAATMLCCYQCMQVLPSKIFPVPVGRFSSWIKL